MTKISYGLNRTEWCPILRVINNLFPRVKIIDRVERHSISENERKNKQSLCISFKELLLLK